MRGGAFFSRPIVPSVTSRRMRVCFSRLSDRFLALRSHSSPRTTLPVYPLARVLVSTPMAASSSTSVLLRCGPAGPEPLLRSAILVATASHLSFLCGLARRPGGDWYSLMRLAKGSFVKMKLGSTSISLLMALIIAIAKESIIEINLKPGNLLLDLRGILRVSDFGLSTLSQNGVGLLHTACGTLKYVVLRDIGSQYIRF